MTASGGAATLARRETRLQLQPLPEVLHRDEATREARIARTIVCVEIGAALGANTISTESGGPLDGLSQKEGRRLWSVLFANESAGL